MGEVLQCLDNRTSQRRSAAPKSAMPPTLIGDGRPNASYSIRRTRGSLRIPAWQKPGTSCLATCTGKPAACLAAARSSIPLQSEGGVTSRSAGTRAGAAAYVPIRAQETRGRNSGNRRARRLQIGFCIRAVTPGHVHGVKAAAECSTANPWGAGGGGAASGRILLCVSWDRDKGEFTNGPHAHTHGAGF